MFPTTRKSRPKVVVVGCGFAGSAAIRALARSAGASIEIKAFDKQTRLYNYPALPRLLNESIPPDQIEVPLDKVFQGLAVDLYNERVQAIDAGRHIVRTHAREMTYDYLVLALGSRALTLEQDDGIFVVYPKARRHLARLAELLNAGALRSATPSDGIAPHRIAVVGGGLTGVEFAMGIREAADRASPQARLASEWLEVNLYEGAERLNPIGPATLSTTLRRELTACGINVFLGREVQRVTRQGLVTQGGSAPVDTVVCCIGSQPNLRVDFVGMSVQARGIAVDAMLRCTTAGSVFVVGDGMLFYQDGQARMDLRQAYRAAAQGRHAARNIARLLRGKQPLAYRPPQLPIGVMLQSNRGVFCFLNRCLSGRLAGRVKRWLELRNT